jgi:hypothetical protein
MILDAISIASGVPIFWAMAYRSNELPFYVTKAMPWFCFD